MKHTKRPLFLARETIRQLTSPDLGNVAGGVPSSYPFPCKAPEMRVEFTDECPSAYTTCPNSCSN
jgi:hypothetical protein